MPLSDPSVERQPLHRRAIEFNGFEREDGLWDIEGRITDTKTYGFTNQDRGWIEPGGAVHDMWIRLTVDESFEIKDVEVAIDSGPYTLCADIAPSFSVLRGITIKPGWYAEVRRRVGGTKGCTHVVELLRPMATAVLQTIYPAIRGREKDKSKRRPMQLNGCHALNTEGDLVRQRMPEYYTGSKTDTKTS